MFKGLYICEQPVNEQAPSGVEKKMVLQRSVFQSAGFACEFYPLNQGGRVETGLFHGLLRRLPFNNSNPRWAYYKAFDTVDFVYFRKPSYINGAMRKFLRALKKANPSVLVLMEIPTYPYDAEYGTSILEKPFYWKDRYNRKKLTGLIDRLVIISDEELGKVFGVPTISIINGIDVSKVPLRKPVRNDTIDLLAVANFSNWHGYDRLLKGMERYYQEGGQRDIKLHLVGEGQELTVYQAIAKSEYLVDRVVFHGFKGGEDLQKLYDLADIGVCSLGMYRKGFAFTSELKSREYLAQGLPIIVASRLDILAGEKYPFVTEYPNEDTPLDMQIAVEMFDRLKSDENQLETIRGLAAGKADIHVTFRPVTDYLKSNIKMRAEA